MTRTSYQFRLNRIAARLLRDIAHLETMIAGLPANDADRVATEGDIERLYDLRVRLINKAA